MAEAGFTLVDARGRKYLTAEERTRFLVAAEVCRRELLSWTEARVSRTLSWRRSDAQELDRALRAAPAGEPRTPRRPYWGYPEAAPAKSSSTPGPTG